MFNPLGSLNTSSSPIQQVPSNIEIQTDTKVNDITNLTNKDYVNKTFTNRTAYNTLDSFTSISSMYGYASATPIEVTYYSINHVIPHRQTYDSDFALSLKLTRNFIKILNFELRLEGELSYSYDVDTNISSCEGSAYIFPRFDVSVGDVFLYKLGDGTLGLFKVNNKERLSIDKDSIHKVSFELNRFPNKAELNELESYVDRVAYFFKDMFLNNSVGLIFDEEYQLLKSTNNYKEKLLYYYVDTFYDYNDKTFYRPDKIYDPYIIDFMFTFINFYKMNEYPLQLLKDRTTKDKRSIFELLVHPDRFDRTRVTSKIHFNKKEYSNRDSDINNLINKIYLKLGDNGDYTEDYILSNFTNRISEKYDGLELILENYLVNRKIQPEMLFTLLENYRSLSDVKQFYYIPIYLFLLAIIEGAIFR